MTHGQVQGQKRKCSSGQGRFEPGVDPEHGTVEDEAIPAALQLFLTKRDEEHNYAAKGINTRMREGTTCGRHKRIRRIKEIQSSMSS